MNNVNHGTNGSALSSRMHIRRTHTNNSATGERYFTYRLSQVRRQPPSPTFQASTSLRWNCTELVVLRFEQLGLWAMQQLDFYLNFWLWLAQWLGSSCWMWTMKTLPLISLYRALRCSLETAMRLLSTRRSWQTASAQEPHGVSRGRRRHDTGISRAAFHSPHPATLPSH